MSTAIRFYALRTKTLEQALPELLTRAYEQGKRIVVKSPEAARLNELLWTWRADSFLPHGMRGEKDGDTFSKAQPVWLTDGDDNPNNATILMLTHGTTAALDTYELACDIFDGNDDDATTAARARWKDYSAAGHAVTYWQQNDRGAWEQKS